MKTIKIIDLLNKNANGEEMPQKIKVGNKIYNYETFHIGEGDNYFAAEWKEVKGYRTSYDDTYYYLEIRDYNLNDEVEILEEAKKIPEKLPNKFHYTGEEEVFSKKINEILDYLEAKGK